MHKVGKIFMEDSKIEVNEAGQRITICPICGEEIILADNEIAGDSTWCELCDTPIKLIE